MNNANFNYWLQGFFEIQERDSNKSIENDLVPSLSEGQVACIREHLELVKKTEPLNGFAAWLEGYVDARVGQVGGDIGAQGYMAISEKLKESFQHLSNQSQSLAATLASMGQYIGGVQIGSGGGGGTAFGAGSLLTC